MPDKKYYWNHKEELQKKAKEYRLSHKDKISGYMREYYRKNPNKRRTKESSCQSYALRRDKFISMYGGKCVCCGEAHKEFLTIEHKNGQKGHKKETSFHAYSQATKKYSPNLYEILCMNCNHSKGKYGYCPHQDTKI